LAKTRAARHNPKIQKWETELCARSVKYFFNNWVYTLDPRLAALGLPTVIPFDLFPRQEELLDWLDARLAAREDGLLEKSRDIGATWLLVGWAVHKWLFTDGFKTSFGSRKGELVDRLGDPDSIFEKMRQLIRLLPPWMKPRRFIPVLHDNHMRIVNPANGNVIRGEAGDEMGRGGRSTAYVIDEAAHVPRADGVDAATSANTDCRIWVSSVDGMGNLFARKRHGGQLRPDQIFTFHYFDDPRMTPERIAMLKNKMEEWAWNAEYEIDYSASVEGICIPAKWVKASQELEALCRAKGIVVEPLVRGIGGLDVGGGGKGKSVYVGRFGPVVTLPEAWGEPDTTDTANRGRDLAMGAVLKRADGTECRIGTLNFDSVGVGAGVLSALKKPLRGLLSVGINVGLPPTENTWPDGLTSIEKFSNLKAELWFSARSRFKASNELAMFLRGETGGQNHHPSDCIFLPPSTASKDMMVLATQLSLPKIGKNEKGKLALETKAQLALRGIASPDHAEAFMLTFAESNVVGQWLAAFGKRPKRDRK